MPKQTVFSIWSRRGKTVATRPLRKLPASRLSYGHDCDESSTRCQSLFRRRSRCTTSLFCVLSMPTPHLSWRSGKHAQSLSDAVCMHHVAAYMSKCVVHCVFAREQKHRAPDRSLAAVSEPPGRQGCRNRFKVPWRLLRRPSLGGWPR